MEKISVIIPVYNTEEFLTTCIESVIKQSYRELEIIIINNGSTDKSQSIIEEFAESDDRIKFYNLNDKKGVGATRNYGVDQATGEYIYFLDSDDYIPEDTLKILQTNMGDHDIVRGKMRTTNLSNSFAIVFNGFYNPKMFTDNRYNLIRNYSATSFLFKRDFILEKKLKFSEELTIYPDMEFMIPALSNVTQIPLLNEAIYFKRKRHDPISNPSLSQYELDIRIPEFLNMYNSLKNKYKDHLANQFLDECLLNFYRKDIVIHLKENYDAIDEIFSQLATAVSKVDGIETKKRDILFKREIKTIKKANKKSYKRLNRSYSFFRDLRRGITSRHRFKIFIYEHFFKKLSVKDNLIFFESFLGKSYSDSPKYIYEYLQQSNGEYKFVWAFNSKKDVPGNAIQVKRFSLRYFYYLGRARFWITNARMSNGLKKRKETTYLQTWHGTPLKRLAGDQENVFMPGTNPVTYKINFKKEADKWDYLVSPNAYSSSIFKSAFWFKKKMLEFGYPRNDVLYKYNNEQDISNLKKKMKLPEDKKILLYAPTWRDDEYYSKGNYKFALKFDLNKMQAQLGDKYIIILRMHYLIASNIDISDYKGFVYDFSSYDDISELYLVSDILMTDYSSVFFDYANLQRPILFFTYDFEKYRDQLRGFYLDIETEVPGPLLMSTDEIIHSILNIEELNKDFKDRYDQFYRRFCEWDDGNATANIVRTVIEKEKGN